MLLPLQLNLASGAGDTTLFASLTGSGTLTGALTTDIQLAAQLTGVATLVANLSVDAPDMPVDATWPVLLPYKIMEDGYRELQPAGSALRSGVGYGPDKQRNRYTTIHRPFSGMFEMTSAQLDIFWSFYRSTLGNGVLPFDGLPHLRTGETVNHRFNVSTPPQVQPNGWDSFLVSVSLEIVP